LGKTISGKNMIRALKKYGYKELYTEGSHTHLRMGEIKITIPAHGNKELKTGTMNNILKTVGLSFEKIKKLI